GCRPAAHPARRRAAAPDRELLHGAARTPRGRRTGRRRRPDAALLRQVVRRPEAARAVRAGAVRQSRPAVPGRADGRHGHPVAAATVVDGAATGRQRMLDRADDALPGGSRGPGRPCLRDDPRTHHQRRDGGRIARACRAQARALPQCAGTGHGHAMAGGRRGADGRGMPVDVHAPRGGPVASPARRGSRVARHRGPGRRPGRSLHRTDQRGRLMNVATAYVEEARSETLRYLRNPGFLLPIILFPAAFYLMFGVALSSKTAPEAARYLLASYSTFGVMAPGLFGFGVSLAL